MRPVPISPNTFSNKRSQCDPWLFGVYHQRKFASEDRFVFLVFLILSLAADAVQNLMINENPYKQILGLLMTHKGLLCHRRGPYPNYLLIYAVV